MVQGLPPFHSHCTNCSNCMCHAGNSEYQTLNDLFWNLNRVISPDNKNNHNFPMAQLKSNLYIFKVFFTLFVLLIVIILFRFVYVFVSWFIHRNDFNNYPVVVICCCCCCWFLSLCDASNLQYYIVMYSTVSIYDSFNTGFGTVTVGGKFDNHVCRICGPHVYKYPLVWRTAAPNHSINYKQPKQTINHEDT